MKKTWFSVKAQESGGSKAAEVSIRGLIGEWGITDRDLIAQVEALGEIENLTVRINSRGGEVDHAVGIFNFLRDHAANVHVVVEGVAMSSGSLIAMAGDKITMRSNAIMMIHNPWTFAAGNARQLRAQAEILEKFEAALGAVYVSRTGKTEDEIKAMLDGPEGDGIYMTASEALAEGFADEIEDAGKKKQASAMAAVMAGALGIPDDVLARIEAAEAQANDGEPGDGDPAPANDDPAGGGDPEPTDTVTDQINAVIVAAGFGDLAGVWLLDDKINSVQAAKDAVAMACEVRALCVAAKKPDEATKLIRDRATLAEARKHLIDILADADEETHTSSQRPNPNSTQRQASGAEVWAKVFPTAAQQ